jgi:hypothetical protein
MLKRYGLTVNHSDRALAKLSDTQSNGNTPQKVYEARRKKGFLFEHEWSWGSGITTWAEYMAEIPKNLITLAVGNAAEWSFWHDYVPTDTTSLENALRYSPLGVSVALMPDGDGRYYRPDGWQDTHWAVLKGYYENGDWRLYDTYPPFEKRVRAGYQFGVAKVIQIDRQIINPSAWSRFISLLRSLLGYV